MDNVLVGYKGGNTGGDTSICDGWPLPAIGEAVAFRLYMRHGLNNPGGDLDASSNHPIEAGAGSIAFSWAWKFGFRADDYFDDFKMAFQEESPTKQYSIGTEYPPGTVLTI
jgi:hypothetical protein